MYHFYQLLLIWIKLEFLLHFLLAWLLFSWLSWKSCGQILCFHGKSIKKKVSKAQCRNMHLYMFFIERNKLNCIWHFVFIDGESYLSIRFCIKCYTFFIFSMFRSVKGARSRKRDDVLWKRWDALKPLICMLTHVHNKNTEFKFT